MTTVSNGLGPSVYRFGDYELDRRTLELRRSGEKLKLAPQPAAVLRLLVSRPGELVSRDEIRRELWGDDTFVDFDRNLNYCLTCIRDALGDAAQNPRFIETLPRRGYRFIAALERPRSFAEPTLAVLPFANLNGDPALEYFADGVTDVLITELARIKSVRVISRQSVLHLKGSSRKLEEIAQDLGIDGIVEGAVLHEGNRARLTAQLVLAAPERHVWAQCYECDVSGVLATQREAARAIAASVAGALAPPRRPATPGTPGTAKTTNVAPEIVEGFLKASAGVSSASAEGFATALRHLREITLKAPDFAPGLAGHAVCLFCLGWFGHAPAREVYPAAMQLALQAVAVDDSASGPHFALATMHWLLEDNRPAAEAEFRRAIELGPSDANAHTLYALFLCVAGRLSESIGEAEYALRLSPTSLIQNQAAAWVYLHATDDAKAEAQARRTIELFPDSLQPQFVLGWAAWRQGKTRDALAAFEKSVALSREALSLAFLGHVYGQLDRAAKARRLLREIDGLLRDGRASPIAFVIIYAGLGDLNKAFEWLETAWRTRVDLLWLTPGFPGLDPLRRDQRCAALLSRMGAAS
jgi:TolB-like protein/Flp pilus assembly protein TadD